MKITKIKFLSFIFLTLFSLVSNAIPEATIEDRLSVMEAENLALKLRTKSLEELAAQERLSNFNPAITLIGDIRGKLGLNMKDTHHHHDDGDDREKGHHHSFSSGFSINHLELELRGEMPDADALVVLAVEDIEYLKETRLHVEEAFIRFKRWPGLSSAPVDLKAGLFKTAIGRMNRVHSHNLNQIDAPQAMKRFLGEEGYASTGLSANFSFATSQNSALNFFLEGVMGNKLPMQKEGAEKMPTGIAHAWWHTEIAPSHYLDIGASALVGRGPETKLGAFSLFAGDLHYTYQPLGYGQNPLFLFGNEFYTANMPIQGSSRWPLGNAAWAQVYLFDSTFLGVRHDLFPKEHQEDKLQHAAGLYFTHYASEFLRFRFGVEHVMPELASLAGEQHLTLSTMFVLGNHPVEPYFANR